MTTGVNHRLSFHEGPDNVGTADEVVGGDPIVRRRYRVVKELFKRGRLWSPGEEIDLDPSTGDAFLSAGEVSELDETSPE